MTGYAFVYGISLSKIMVKQQNNENILHTVMEVNGTHIHGLTEL